MALIPSQIQNVFACIYNFLDLSASAIYQQSKVNCQLNKSLYCGTCFHYYLNLSFIWRTLFTRKTNLKTIKCFKKTQKKLHCLNKELSRFLHYLWFTTITAVERWHLWFLTIKRFCSSMGAIRYKFLQKSLLKCYYNILNTKN